MSNPRLHGWIICLMVTLMALPGCTRVVKKIPQLSGADAENGWVRFNYDQWNFEIPNVQWEDALSLADRRCKDWGYPGVLKAPNPEKTCVNGQPSNCMAWDITTTLSCKRKADERPAPAPVTTPKPAPPPAKTAMPRPPDAAKFNLASQCSTIADVLSKLVALDKTTDAAGRQEREETAASLSRQSDSWAKVSYHLAVKAGLSMSEVRRTVIGFSKELALDMKKKKDYDPMAQDILGRYTQCRDAVKSDPELLALWGRYGQ